MIMNFGRRSMSGANDMKLISYVKRLDVQKPGGTRPCWPPCFGPLGEGGYNELPETI
jgi:hypothetical protein